MITILANEAHHAEGYVDLLKSVPHWLFELTTDAVFAVPAYFFGRWQLRRHDEEHHGPQKPLR